MARPTEYNEEIITKTQAYLEACEDEEVRNIKEEMTSTRGTEVTKYEVKLRVNLPTIEGLALELEVNRDTIYDWEGKYPEFSDILSKLRGKQAKMLINKGLSDDYNPVIAKLLLMKHGYTEKTESKTETTLTITEEDKAEAQKIVDILKRK